MNVMLIALVVFPDIISLRERCKITSRHGTRFFPIYMTFFGYNSDLFFFFKFCHIDIIGLATSKTSKATVAIVIIADIQAPVAHL